MRTVHAKDLCVQNPINSFKCKRMCTAALLGVCMKFGGKTRGDASVGKRGETGP